MSQTCNVSKEAYAKCRTCFQEVSVSVLNCKYSIIEAKFDNCPTRVLECSNKCLNLTHVDMSDTGMIS